MRKTVVLCDLDGGDDPRPGVAVIEVAIEGVFRPLDVCKEHLELLRTLPQGKAAPAQTRSRRQAKPAVRSQPASKQSARRSQGPAAGRFTGQGKTAATATSKRQPTSRRSRQAKIAAARDWARAQGREVADLGRLPAGLLEEYEAAQR